MRMREGECKGEEGQERRCEGERERERERASGEGEMVRERVGRLRMREE